MGERFGGSVEIIDDPDILDEILGNKETNPYTLALNELKERYGNRVFTYKSYAGTVQDLADSCPAFAMHLEMGADAAADWLELHDGTPEDAPEDDDVEKPAETTTDDDTDKDAPDDAPSSEKTLHDTHHEVEEDSSQHVKPTKRSMAEQILQQQAVAKVSTDKAPDKEAAEPQAADTTANDYEYIPVRETVAPRLPETKLEVRIPRIHPPLAIPKEPTILSEIKEEFAAIDAAADERRAAMHPQAHNDTQYSTYELPGDNVHEPNLVKHTERAQQMGGVVASAVLPVGSTITENIAGEKPDITVTQLVEEASVQAENHVQMVPIEPNELESLGGDADSEVSPHDLPSEAHHNSNSENTVTTTNSEATEPGALESQAELDDEMSTGDEKTVQLDGPEITDDKLEETHAAPLLSEMLETTTGAQDMADKEQSPEDNELDGVELLHMIVERMLELDDDAYDHTTKTRFADMLFGSPTSVAQIEQVLSKAQSSIEKLRRAQSTEDCQDALDELARALEQLLQMAGYNHAHDIVNRLLKHHKIDELQAIIEYCLVIIRSDDTRRQNAHAPRGLSRLAAYVLALHKARHPDYAV